MARFGEQMVILWATLFGARFIATEALWKLIFGDKVEHDLQERCLFARLAMRGVNDIGKVTQGIQGAFEADSAQFHTMADGRVLHERADKVVGNDVKQEFFLDHLWRQAAQDVES